MAEVFFSRQRPGDAVDEVPTGGLREEAVGTRLRVLQLILGGVVRGAAGAICLRMELVALLICHQGIDTTK